MFYVIQVSPAKEAQTEAKIEKEIKDRLQVTCFHLTRKIKKKFRGTWHDVTQKLLPGYIFIDTDQMEELYGELKKIPMLTKLLGREDDLFISLNPEEEAWVRRLISQGTDVPISRIGFDEGDRVVILSGPLMDMEGQIKKYNLHRRTAEVEVDFMGNKTVIFLGIDVVGKKDDLAD